MEKIIEEKLKKQHAEEYCDAFDYMLSSAKDNDYEMTLQELKVNMVWGYLNYQQRGALGQHH